MKIRWANGGVRKFLKIAVLSKFLTNHNRAPFESSHLFCGTFTQEGSKCNSVENRFRYLPVSVSYYHISKSSGGLAQCALFFPQMLFLEGGVSTLNTALQNEIDGGQSSGELPLGRAGSILWKRRKCCACFSRSATWIKERSMLVSLSCLSIDLSCNSTVTECRIRRKLSVFKSPWDYISGKFDELERDVRNSRHFRVEFTYLLQVCMDAYR